jgi:hypothetical protein
LLLALKLIFLLLILSNFRRYSRSLAIANGSAIVVPSFRAF